ncbi:MAG: hypothetical protein AAF696_06790, partial [Bacteroidota bacterium]
MTTARDRVLRKLWDQAGELVTTKEFANGIRLALQPRVKSKTLSFEICIDAGSIEDEVPGTAHFLEHTLIPTDMDLEIKERNGNFTNVATAGEYILIGGDIPNTPENQVWLLESLS